MIEYKITGSTVQWPDSLNSRRIAGEVTRSELYPKKNRGHRWHIREGSILEGILFALLLVGMAYVLFFLIY